MEEIWKDIRDYEGYQVSNLGNVRSLDYKHTGKVQVLKPGKKGNGYLYLRLYKDGKIKDCYVHRLVAQAFLPNPDNLPQVNHKNENPSNNRVENLEWCSAEYNSNYGTRNQRVSEVKRGTPRSEETKRKLSIPVAQYSKEGKLIAIYYAGKDASKQTGIRNSSISNCCRGKYKSAGGFIWKYA